jgi:hypothetical protein
MSISVRDLNKRLLTLEYFVAKLYAGEAVESGISLEQFKQIAAGQIEMADREVFSSLDPVQSDLVAAEWRDCVERMMRLQTEILAQMLAKKSQGGGLSSLGFPLP